MRWDLSSSYIDFLLFEIFFMRVLSCKLKCLSVCFSRPSHSIQIPPPLKLEDAQDNFSCQSSVPQFLEEQSAEQKIDEAEKVESSEVKVEILTKSSLKKSAGAGAGEGVGSEVTAKGRVKWMDFVGKELVEIREFEAT